jgi:xanthine dehydrogenase YagS FAD-binding subunit
MAVALAAFDAEVVVLGVNGERRVALTHLYRLPGTSPHRDTVLEHGELITGVVLPATPVARHSTYRKVRDRASYAFALVSVAAALAVEDGLITEARVALGGVAHRPWRAYAVEGELRGRPASEETYRRAAGAELCDAHVHPGNAFKVPLVTNTLVAVLRELAWRQSGPPPATCDLPIDPRPITAEERKHDDH